MHELKAFQYHNHEFRTIQDGEQLLFVAKDVCQALELDDVSKACQNLPEDEKLIRTLFVSGQSRNMICVTESGLYRLIFRSNKPEAEIFRTWVFSEVLPAIRKTGSYVMPGQSGFNEDVLNQMIGMMSLMGKTLARLERLETKAANQSARGLNIENVRAFVNDCCTEQPGCYTLKSSLYEAYELYCQQTGAFLDAKPHFFVKLYRCLPEVSQGRILINGVRTAIVTGLYLEA